MERWFLSFVNMFVSRFCPVSAPISAFRSNCNLRGVFYLGSLDASELEIEPFGSPTVTLAQTGLP